MDYTEKRDFQRMMVDASVEYRKQGENIVHQGIAKNLSGQGMLFLAQEALKPDTQIHIKLSPASPVTPPMQAELRVIRCQQQNDGDFQVACEILCID